MTPSIAVRALVDRTFESFQLEQLLAALRRSTSNFSLVGGSVRDSVQEPGILPVDIDLMTSDDPSSYPQELFRLGEPRVNRHGNLRFALQSGRHVDVINTRNFYGRARSVRQALLYFDASVNALAIDLDGTQLIDPLGGFGHLRAGRVVLPEARWRPGDPFEDVHVLLRLLRLIDRTGLKVSNPAPALKHRALFDLVDWDDLARLNGFGRADAERKFERVFAPHSSATTAPALSLLHGVRLDSKTLA